MMKQYEGRKVVIQLEREEGLKEGLKEGIEKGKKEGLEEGLEKGKLEEKKETIIKGNKKGLSNDILSDLTGLSIKDIDEILRNQD